MYNHICVCMIKSLCSTPETHNIVTQLYFIKRENKIN